MSSPWIIDDSTDINVLNSGRMTGMVPRDYSVQPATVFAKPDAVKLIPRSEWQDRIKERKARGIGLRALHKREGWKNLDQNGHGYCWAYSTGHAIMLKRTADNQPYVRLNPHATAAIIKRGRDEGGWCGLSAEWAVNTGYAIEGTEPGEWPLHSRNLKFDTPELRAAMALHKISEPFLDLQLPAYDRNMDEDRIVSCLLQNIPVPADFQWWGHSVCLGDLDWGNDGLIYELLNSWQGWGDDGWGQIVGSKRQTMGAFGCAVVTASVN